MISFNLILLPYRLMEAEDRNKKEPSFAILEPWRGGSCQQLRCGGKYDLHSDIEQSPGRSVTESSPEES